MNRITISRAARKAGVGVETIRFYERKGLLPAPPRSRSGYRQFPAHAVERLRFIRRAQDLGFSLREIGDLLALRVDEVAACATVERQARDKLAQVSGKIRELRRIERALESLVKACQAREPTSDCPILEEFEERRATIP